MKASFISMSTPFTSWDCEEGLLDDSETADGGGVGNGAVNALCTLFTSTDNIT